MDGYQALKQQFGSKAALFQLGTVVAVLDGTRMVVQLRNHVQRRIYGSAELGSSVAVRGERLVCEVAPAGEAVY